MSDPVRSSLIVSPVIEIEADWVDYNGHLNQAYYGVIFDRSVDDALMPVGLGPDYITQRNCSYMTVESHTCFIRELVRPDAVRVVSRILDVDDKRLHMFAEMRHSTDDWLAATVEYMFLHIDMSVRRTAPWPADLRVKLDALKAQSDALPWPERAGRRIGIPRK
ncbi:MAG: thioesterase family protein [Hyphomicrobiaceae bacterium]